MRPRRVTLQHSPPATRCGKHRPGRDRKGKAEVERGENEFKPMEAYSKKVKNAKLLKILKITLENAEKGKIWIESCSQEYRKVFLNFLEFLKF